MPPQATSRKHKLSSLEAKPPRRYLKIRRGYDPILSLNEDTINMIFSLIPSAELIRFERVSHGWQAAVRAWIETFGLRTRFRSSWLPAHDDGAENATRGDYEVFKRHARREYLMQRGRPTRVTRLRSVWHLASAGDYVVWLTSGDYQFTPDQVFWQCLSRIEEGSARPAVSIPLSRILGSDRPPGQVSGLAVNRDGVILMHIVPRSDHWTSAVGVDALYSAVDNRIIRRQDWLLAPVSTSTEQIPVLIGKSSTYCVNGVHNGYTLSAFDFHGKLLYLSPEYARVWARSYDVRAMRDECMKDFRILQARNEEDLIFVTSCSQARFVDACDTTIHIIQGTTGNLVYSARYPQSWNFDLHSDPATNTLALTSRPKSVRSASGDGSMLEGWAILQRFSYQPRDNPRLALLTTDAIQTPSVVMHSGPGYPVVDPFNSAAFSCPVVLPAGRRHVQGHVVTPTTDEGHLTTARGLLRSAFGDQSHPPLGQCFVFASGEPVTLPLKPGEGRHRRSNFDLSRYTGLFSLLHLLKLTDKGHVLVKLKCNVFVLQF
ncbi:uncharacterized protein BJX67DRAFT_382458 [Aspergillus lucknowensis]|uniref:F-box domain-containing protein n=1 Tax=Aspergillus lucknowensis TaxID=176173 RepID=A0ABR4LMZ6_9EURO